MRTTAIALGCAAVLAACGPARSPVAQPTAAPTPAPVTSLPSPQVLPSAPETSPYPSETRVAPQPTSLGTVQVAEPTAPLHLDPAGPAVIHRVPTAQRVVFVTVDDGWTRDPGLAAMVSQAHLPLTLFLVGQAVQADVAYWRAMTAAGSVVEDHTMTHARLTTLTAAGQQAEVCRDADLVAARLGRRPTLLRPPYGSYDAATVAAAGRCGLAAVVLWDVSAVHGRLHYAVGTSLRPGDVILVHFGPTVRADLAAVVDAVQRSGFAVGSLEDFLRVRRPATPPAPAPSTTGP